MKRTSILILLTASLLWACSSSNDSKTNKPAVSAADSTQLASVYQCPMDCEKGKTYEQAGKCPVCGMDLELKTKE